jgi:hypothetical protein
MKIQIINIIIISSKINILFINNFCLIIINFRVYIYFVTLKRNSKKKKTKNETLILIGPPGPN